MPYIPSGLNTQPQLSSFVASLDVTPSQCGNKSLNINISAIPDGFLANASLLESIDLSNNMLTSLPADLFHNLTALTYIRLANNHLSQLLPETISELPNTVDIEVSTILSGLC
eukprot:TRINITY_DN10112_c0_g1_i1.p2 TRINITY_DN10112_c0_g1~~TRINITY_DN10112_c0_g1_i1.p2  ORF type:complete len:113 (+),score=9.88 TRINITY_DN10112_c0_g1_i1:892-1230(+)